MERTSLLADLAGPGGLAELLVVRLRRDVRVDQRGAAEPTANQNVHVVADPDVEERVRISGGLVGVGELKSNVPRDLAQTDGELAQREFAAALENHYAAIVSSQACCGDAAAVSGAHDGEIDLGESRLLEQ